MKTLDTTTDIRHPCPRCILCGGVAWRRTVWRDSDDPPGIRTGFFVCANDHIWSVRWFDPSLDNHAA